MSEPEIYEEEERFNYLTTMTLCKKMTSMVVAQTRGDRMVRTNDPLSYGDTPWLAVLHSTVTLLLKRYICNWKCLFYKWAYYLKPIVVVVVKNLLPKNLYSFAKKPFRYNGNKNFVLGNPRPLFHLFLVFSDHRYNSIWNKCQN